MSRSNHQSWYLVEGLKRVRGQVKQFSKYVLARSAKHAKLKVKGWNKTVYRMDDGFVP